MYSNTPPAPSQEGSYENDYSIIAFSSILAMRW